MLHTLRGRLSLSRALRFLYFWSRARPGSLRTGAPASLLRPSERPTRRAFVLPDSPGPMVYAPPDRGFSDSFCENSYETQGIFTGVEIIMRVGLVHPV
jgi:hypothetical protein